MASTYKSPGAYVEEITKFPPSVAAVETAIPAFIGYTEKAEKNGESLLKVPLKIDSFLEFEQFFGGPPSRDVIIRLNTSNQFVRTELKDNRKPYLLYDSLRLFYDNGGGICYVISVGDYKTPPEIGNNVKGILAGLRAIEKYDEPTLLVCPDAVSTDTGLYSFQQQALLQCNTLQDRFLICDLLKSDEEKAGETLEDRVAQFRDNIGINYLKYGAAYVPWLRTSLPLNLLFRDVTFAFESELSPTEASSLSLLLSLTSSPAIQQLLYDLDNARKTVNTLRSNLNPGGALVDADVKDLRDQMKKLQKAFMTVYNNPASTTYAAFTATLTPIYQKIRDITGAVKTLWEGLPAVVSSLPVPSNTQTVEFKLRNDINTLKAPARTFFGALATHHKEYAVKSSPTVNLLTAGTALNDLITFLGFSPATIADIPVDIATRHEYRMIAARKASYDQLVVTANTGTNPATVSAAVASVVPATNDLKSRIDSEIATAKTGAPDTVTVSNNLNTKLTNPATSASDKQILAIAKSFVDEERANGIATVADLVPDPPGFPPSLANSLYLDLQNLKRAAELAAAASGATKATVVAAVTVAVAFPREYALLAANGAVNVAASAIALYETVMNTAQTYEHTFDQSLLQSFGIYKTLVTRAGQDIMVLPPSGGVAGVYASVDSNRGVWKAPANASLASVLGPFTVLNVQDQEGLNVDANAGKSINAIRQFSGKGTLVWGTRTLAGNDNEWRYVSVRRFFNYAEESIKKATEPFVFEANDLNTWVRVKAMIENFLTLEWRRGALAGSKPDNAFYVKVGLGETMTALDILEGRMIIEVGMAVVRPAEFIILRFAHMMQES